MKSSDLMGILVDYAEESVANYFCEKGDFCRKNKKEIADNPQEVPVFALIFNFKTQEYRIFSNRVIELFDPTAHAEILAIRTISSEIRSEFLTDYDIYVTLEPCMMCMKAISLAKIRRVFFGAYDVFNHDIFLSNPFFMLKNAYVPEIFGGIFESRCDNLMKKYFKNLRDMKKNF